MKNALILHGTDFDKDKNQRKGNWFPWLKTKLEEKGYEVYLPELPQVWKPNLDRYWEFLKDFDFNKETIIIGHSSGATTIFGLLNRLPNNIKIKLVISVAGFYKDGGWNCEGLFEEEHDWDKIKNQAENIVLYWSPNDPYIKSEQTDYLANKLNVEPIVIENQGHFSVGTVGEKYRKFPELLELIN